MTNAVAIPRIVQDADTGTFVDRESLEAKIRRAAASVDTAKVTLGFRRYVVKSPAEFRLFRSLEIEGTVGTEIEFQTTEPLQIKAPSDAGYGNLKTVTTGCVGFYFRGTQFKGSGLKISNVTIVGHTGTVSTPGHYYLIGSEMNRTELENVVFSNTEVKDYDSSNNVSYKALSARNFNSLTMLMCGTDIWEEPNPYFARPVDRVTIRNVTVEGEYLDSAASQTQALRGIHLRKVNMYDIDGFTFGSFGNTGNVPAREIVFTGQPSNNQTISFLDWNPYTKESSVVTYTAVSGTPSNAFQFKIGSSALETCSNLQNAINSNRGDGAGSSFLRAVPAQKYLPGLSGNTVAAFRLERLVAGEPATTDPNDLSVVYPQAWNHSDVLNSNGLSNVTTYNINDSHYRFAYAQWAIRIEDSMPGSVRATIGPSNFSKSQYINFATLQQYDFNYRFSEGGHDWVSINTHDTYVGTAVVHVMNGGFFHIPRKGNNWGKIQAGTAASPGQAFRCEPGVNYCYIVSGSSNPSNGDTLTLTDENGSTVVYEFRTSGAASGQNVKVDVGADITATLKNLRRKITASCDAHTLMACAEMPTGSSPTTMLIRFFTLSLFETAPTIAKSSSNLSITNARKPYRAANCDFDANIHWTFDNEQHNVPYVYMNGVFGPSHIGGFFQHVRGMNPAYTSKAWGIVRFNGVPTANDAIVIDSITDASKTFVAVNSGASGLQFNKGTTAAEAATNLAATINAQGLSFAALAYANFVIVVDGAVGKNTAFLANTVDAGNVIDLIGGFSMTLSAALTNTTRITLNYGPGLNAEFKFISGGGTDVAGSLYHINIATATTIAAQMAALKVKLDSFAVFVASNSLGYSFSSVDANNVLQFCTLAVPASNTATITETADPDNRVTLFQYLTGSDSADLQGLRAPVVLIDCAMPVVDTVMGPYVDGGYTDNSIGTTTDPVFAEAYDAVKWLSAPVLDAAFGQTAMNPVYIKKTSSGLTCKAKLKITAHGPFGRGALSEAKTYILGTNVVAADVRAAGSYVDGTAI